MSYNLQKKICRFLQNLAEAMAMLTVVQIIIHSGILLILSIIFITVISLLTVFMGPSQLLSFCLALNPKSHFLAHLVVVVILTYFVFLAYDIFISKSTIRGGGNRRSGFIRNARIWQYAARYAPFHLIKTSELDPEKNYIMGYHPHGILAAGAAIDFGTEALKLEEMLPGITPHLVTLKHEFCNPLSREITLMCGCSEASKENIEWILTRLGSGNAVVIAVGGVSEQSETRPGAHRLVLKDRKGFIRMAIKTGSSLVPVYSFGKTELFTVVEPSDHPGLYRRCLTILGKTVGLRFSEFYGRGTFLKYLFLPHRHPVYIVDNFYFQAAGARFPRLLVKSKNSRSNEACNLCRNKKDNSVGRPIPVVQCSNPDECQVEDVHRRYMKDLKQLFDDHKHKYDDNPTAELAFI